MASGQTLAIFVPLHNEPPATVYATLDTRNNVPCLDFDADADESAVFSDVLPRNYAGGGITVYLIFAASSDTNAAHKCRWDVSIERGNTDIDADSFEAVQSVTGNPNGTSGITTTVSIAFTDGAQIDSLAVGERFRVKVTRDANHVSEDDMTGDAELYAVEIKET